MGVPVPRVNRALSGEGIASQSQILKDGLLEADVLCFLSLCVCLFVCCAFCVFFLKT